MTATLSHVADQTATQAGHRTASSPARRALPARSRASVGPLKSDFASSAERPPSIVSFAVIAETQFAGA